MAVASAQVTVGTTATLVSAVESDFSVGSAAKVKNTGAADVFLGGAGVTTTTGFALASGATTDVPLGPGEQLFAVAAATGTVHVLRLGV